MAASPILLRFTTTGQTVGNLRSLSTSFKASARFRISPPPSFKEIGRILPLQSGADCLYDAGQYFIHRTFAYRGVIICGFKCRYHEKVQLRTNSAVATTQEQAPKSKQYYQVLIHRPDWPYLGFPVDMTSYLVDNGQPTPSGRNEKILTVINGMDCVSHDDVLPFASTELTPFEHDLFDRIYELHKEDNGVITTRIRAELADNYRHSSRTWLAPRDVFTEVTENIEVTVTTFYLGENVVNGQTKHVWRYVIRIVNHTPMVRCTLRERMLKVYSLNNMNQHQGSGVVGKQPELGPEMPAFQFSSIIDLAHSKGGHLWGKFKMEREDGVFFDVTIPTVQLESFEDSHKAKNAIENNGS